MFSLEVNSLIN